MRRGAQVHRAKHSERIWGNSRSSCMLCVCSGSPISPSIIPKCWVCIRYCGVVVRCAIVRRAAVGMWRLWRSRVAMMQVPNVPACTCNCRLAGRIYGRKIWNETSRLRGICSHFSNVMNVANCGLVLPCPSLPRFSRTSRTIFIHSRCHGRRGGITLHLTRVYDIVMKLILPLLLRMLVVARSRVFSIRP
jgi:hypothetical protein